MYQADKISWFLDLNSTPYRPESDHSLFSHQQFPYEKPQNFDSKWYKAMEIDNTIRKWVGFIIGDFNHICNGSCYDYIPGYEEYGCQCYNCRIPFHGHHICDCYGCSCVNIWAIQHMDDPSGNHLGKIFIRGKYNSVYYFEDDERDDEFSVGYRYYNKEDTPTSDCSEIRYQFNTYSDFRNACSDLNESLVWLRNEVHRLHYPAYNKHEIKQISDQQYQEFLDLLVELKKSYTEIFSNCTETHKAPSAFYTLALQYFDTGLDMNCIENIRKLLEITPPELLSQEISKQISLKKGTAESELALFDEAILTLSTHIQNHPKDKGAYIERAITHFESGDLHSAMEDFSYLEKSDPISADAENLELAEGLIDGIKVGALESIIDFIPSMLSSLNGLSNGLWAFATSPAECSSKMLNACKNIMDFIQTQGASETLQTLFPEVRELIQQGDSLSPQRKGELMGHLIGRHGIEFVILIGAGKAIHAYRDLRHANAILSLEKMALSAEKGLGLEAMYQKWWNQTAPVIEEIKVQEGRLGSKLYKQFKNSYLSETQIRKILHQAKVPTFCRPKGIPHSWEVNLTEKGAGMKYRLNTPGKGGQLHLKAEVRVMPGDPNAKWPSQRNPYVKHNIHGNYLDKYGKIVLEDDAAAHIPFNEYNFEKLSQVIPYE